MARELDFSEKFKKEYLKLPKIIQKKVRKQLGFLVDNPFHPSLKVHLLEGTGGIWEGYVDDSYRFTFEIEKDCYYLRIVGSYKIIDLESRGKF